MCTVCSVAFPIERMGVTVSAGLCKPAVPTSTCANEAASFPGATKLINNVVQHVMIGVHQADVSHTIWRLNDVFFCSVCGSWARQVPRALVKPCSNEADTRGRYVLTRLGKQLPPTTSIKW